MDLLFKAEPGPLPEWRPPTGSWAITAEDTGMVPPLVRHAMGYDTFVTFAARYGTAADTLFDLWAFAHFVRAHRESFLADRDLERSALVFLGNVCIANHPECYWTGDGPTLAIESAHESVDDEQRLHLEPASYRYLGVGDTVPAIREADEARFLEFQSVVSAWIPSAPIPRVRRHPHHEHHDVPTNDS